MLQESGIHTIHTVGGTRKGVHNIQTRIQSKSNLSATYTDYIDKKCDQNHTGNENSP